MRHIFLKANLGLQISCENALDSEGSDCDRASHVQNLVQSIKGKLNDSIRMPIDDHVDVGKGGMEKKMPSAISIAYATLVSITQWFDPKHTL